MRKEARISTSVWRTDFTRLPLACQGLYWMLLAQPDVSMCGVLPYLPGRWQSMCGSEDIDRALELLEEAGMLVVDRATSEVLIRTFVRHDGVLRGPKTRAGMWKSWSGVLSDVIRATVLGQVQDHVDEAVSEGWVSKQEIADVPPLDTPPDTPSEPSQEGASDRASSRARASDLQPPPPPPTTDLGGKPPGKRDELFEAIADVCGIDWRKPITKTERGEINNAAKQLRDIDATTTQVPGKAAAYRKRWPDADLTPSALVKHWSKLDGLPGGYVNSPSCGECGQLLSDHDAETCRIVRVS